MQYTVNGQVQNAQFDHNLGALVAIFCDEPDRVIAEVNGKIIKRDQWFETIITDGDAVELVTLVGGG